ncbi:MAG TPA: alpha/beta hydrolase [Xanthobacteraceae bacterium]|nr:alpha/beta hydrolase [Xanthobacteraceae bacterium]
MDIQADDIEYVTHASGPLLARIYRPKDIPPSAGVISVHGGVWTRETRLTNAVIDEALARAGALVMALDFRMPPIGRYPAAIQDINLATRWLKARASGFGFTADRVGGVGTSSGGHQLMLSAMRPHDPRYAALPLPGEGHDAALAFIAIGWPVLDPLTRYRMAKAKNMTSHVAAHDAYWPDEAAMAEGNPLLILERGENVLLPPALIVQGTADTALPPGMVEKFASAYRRAGGTLELRMYEGQPHTFITKQPDTPASRRAIDLIVAFVRFRSALLE